MLHKLKVDKKFNYVTSYINDFIHLISVVRIEIININEISINMTRIFDDMTNHECYILMLLSNVTYSMRLIAHIFHKLTQLNSLVAKYMLHVTQQLNKVT